MRAVVCAVLRDLRPGRADPGGCLCGLGGDAPGGALLRRPAAPGRRATLRDGVLPEADRLARRGLGTGETPRKRLPCVAVNAKPRCPAINASLLPPRAVLQELRLRLAGAPGDLRRPREAPVPGGPMRRRAQTLHRGALQQPVLLQAAG